MLGISVEVVGVRRGRGVVLLRVLKEERGELSWAGEPAEGQRAQHVATPGFDTSVDVAGRQNVGDAVDQRVHPDGIAVFDAGDDMTQAGLVDPTQRSEEHTSELQSLMRISYAVFCLKKQKYKKQPYKEHQVV